MDDNGPMTIALTDDPATIRTTINELVFVLRNGKPSRERSLAITKLQEALFWIGSEEEPPGEQGR